MDPLVDNDTRGLHWTLNPSESRRLLAVLFPDRELFQRSVELLPAASSRPSLEMNDILEMLRDGNHYGKETRDGDNAKDEDTKGKGKDTKGKGKDTKGKGKDTKGKGKDTKGKGKDTKGMGKDMKKKKAMKKKDSEYWRHGPSAIKSEPNMAGFLNIIMDAVEQAIGGKFLNRRYIISSDCDNLY